MFPAPGSTAAHVLSQRRDIIVSVSRPWLALGATSLQRKDFAAFSSKVQFIFFLFQPCSALYLHGHGLSVSRASIGRLPMSGAVFVSNKSKNNCHVRRRRNRNVPWRPNPRRLINNIIDEVYRLFYCIVHFLVKIPVVVV